MIEILLAGALATGTAILLPSLGELLTQRAGITNLGTEGSMLAGALTGVIVGISSGNSWLGLVSGILAGAVVAALFAWAVVYRRTNQLATGLIVWFLLFGLTSMLGRDYNGQVLAPIGKLAIPGLSDIPFLGNVLFNHSPIVYLGFVLVAAIWWLLTRSRTGLLIRATGERPAVVAAAGNRPQLIQFLTTTCGGALSGLGGSYLSVGVVGNWSNNMTSGYGFIAVTVVIFAAWRTNWATIGSYLFGAAIALASQLQARGFAINQYLLDALPYLLTLAVLVVISSQRKAAPEALNAALAAR